jgi:diguanylate cyclase (GGDEF)-like protein
MARIVVIDDRVTNRNILTRLALSIEEGIQVASFASPTEALRRLTAEAPPDLIITDFNMPGMDGATFIAQLRARSEFADVPIIVVTVYEDRNYCYKALEAGATDFLLSPVDHLEFRARARNLLTLRRQQLLLAQRAADLERQLVGRGGFDPAGAAQAMLDALPAAIAAVDARGRVAAVNRAHERMFTVDRARVVGLPLADVYGEAYATRHGVLDEKVRETAAPLPGARLESIAGQGGPRSLLFAKGPLLDPAGRVQHIYTLALDVTDMRLRDDDAAEISLHDPLTGMAGADVLRERAEDLLARARREDEMLALLHLDLDRFKGLNDAFGRAFADELLRSVAARLKSRLGDLDMIARLHSDEFIILQPGIRRSEEAAELCRRLNESFGEPFHIRAQEVHLSASIGITLFPVDGKALDTLLKNADLAMYRAKASGRDTWRFFAAEMNIAARRAVTLERELRQALAAEQFVVFYQPQLDLETHRMIGMEALVRWNHPRRGLVRPGEFISLAEDIGLIAPLTAWVLQSACRQHRLWQDHGLTGTQLSVNLSPVQFRERGIELVIERVLGESGLAPPSLDIELTENAVIENSQTATASLRYLHQLGVSLSIDDFGTGYSSLSYVKRLPVQRLKIDQSFVQNLESNANDEVIVRAIINLGHSLGLKVIAEGVETEGQMARLQRFGCDQAQGNLISPPLSADDLERRLDFGAPRALARQA